MAAGDALAIRDSVAYRNAARRAVAALPAGELNRPFAMYHLARAEAWLGDLDASLDWLDAIWDEGIERLMISYAMVDSLFVPYRTDAGFEATMNSMRAVEMATEPVAGPVFLLTGAGSNILASIGRDGVFLVDAGYRPAALAVRGALASAGGTTVQFLVDTHVHEDHVGGNDAFGPEAVVIAHRRTAEAMMRPQEFMPGVIVPAREGAALPDVVIDTLWSVAFNGEMIDVLPLPAHTDGDLIVYFSGSHVLHMGDNFFPRSGRGMIFPGADLDQFQQTMARLLERVDSNTLVVSGHDPVTPLWPSARPRDSLNRGCDTLIVSCERTDA